jgi:phosphoserine phosphatase RsbU/P
MTGDQDGIPGIEASSGNMQRPILINFAIAASAAALAISLAAALLGSGGPGSLLAAVASAAATGAAVAGRARRDAGGAPAAPPRGNPVSTAEPPREDRALELELELATAALVQRTLFPRSDLHLPDLDACGFYAGASQTCGDWYGFITDATRRRVVVMIGDVTGHGVPAALVASAANSFIRTIDQLKESFYDLEILVRQIQREIEASSRLMLDPASHDPLSPDRLLGWLNANILETVERTLEMTFFAGTYDVNRRELAYASAGHDPPLVWRARGSARPSSGARGEHVESLSGGGPRIGERKDPSFRLLRTPLDPGDVVLLYTDGLPDCTNPRGEEFGDRRLIGLLERCGGGEAEEIRSEICSSLIDFREGQPLSDDLSFVVIRCR